MPDLDGQVDHIEDDVLRLVFLSCHPSLTPESRAALTLRLVGGLTTAEIARGFLTTESTMGQRISRAKKTLSAAQRRVRAADRRGADRAPRRRDGRDLPDLQRGLHRHRRRGLDASRPRGRGDAARAHARRPRARRARGARPPGAARAPGLPVGGPARRRRRAGAAGGAGPDAVGPADDPARAGRAAAGRGARRPRAAPSAGTSSRPRSPPSTPAPRAPRTPTGGASPPCTTSWPTPRPGPVVEVNRAVAHGRAFGPAAGSRRARRGGPGALGDSPLVPERARRPARAGRPVRRGERGVRRGGRAHPQRGRARGPAPSGGGQSSACGVRVRGPLHGVWPGC